MRIDFRRTALDRAIGFLSPAWELGRLRARVTRQVFASQYEAAGISRRTNGWRRVGGDANAVTGLSLERLRNVSRDLVRNNGHAKSAIRVIADDVVGWGIRPAESYDRWKEWAYSTAIDADGVHDLPGLEALWTTTMVESGEVLIRRRRRRLSDGLPLPLQLQTLEPDHIDSSKHQILPNGAGKIIRGVQFGPLGQRVGYWLFPEHPGSDLAAGQESFFVPASDILHLFLRERPGQVRGTPWFAPSLLRFRDFDDLADATLMKQKVAAVLAAIRYDTDGTAETLGATSSDEPGWDLLEPGLIANVGLAGGIEVVNPPSVRDYPDYAKFTVNELAAGIGVTPEDMTGNYADMNYSSARMSRLRHFSRVSGWRWRSIVPQALNPVWSWSAQAAVLVGERVPSRTEWTAPPLPMLDPDKEGLAAMRNMRAGITNLYEVLREQGYNPIDFLDEYEKVQKALDDRGIVLDSDPRKMTQAGQLHEVMGNASKALDEMSRFLGQLPDQVRDQVVEAAIAAEGGSGE